MATYSESDASGGPTLLHVALAIPSAILAVFTTTLFMVWVPYTLFTGSFSEDGGWRIFIFLYVLATAWVNRKLNEPGFFETNGPMTWWYARGWFAPVAFALLWEAMMLLVGVLPQIADPGYFKESIGWVWTLLP